MVQGSSTSPAPRPALRSALTCALTPPSTAPSMTFRSGMATAAKATVSLTESMAAPVCRCRLIPATGFAGPVSGPYGLCGRMLSLAAISVALSPYPKIPFLAPKGSATDIGLCRSQPSAVRQRRCGIDQDLIGGGRLAARGAGAAAKVTSSRISQWRIRYVTGFLHGLIEIGYGLGRRRQRQLNQLFVAHLVAG
jgi:hypothetical protein